MKGKYRFFLACTLLSTAIIFSYCGVYENESAIAQGPAADTVPPVIFVDRLIDTAYLYTSYNPQDVRVIEPDANRSSCNANRVNVSGYVNINLPGTYFLEYDVSDNSGNSAATVTRTVHVVENKSAYLNGSYDAVSSCTCVNTSAGSRTVTESSYQADITSEPVNRYFKLISLNIGNDHVALSTRLHDSVFEAGFFNPDYHFKSGGTGTVSSGGNKILIETIAYHYSGFIFNCKNVYHKKLVIQNP